MSANPSTAQAVFSDAFQFPGTAINPQAPEYIERDRLIMAARPGLARKLLPIRKDETGVYCGGCYLFDTLKNAEAYANWVAEDFVLDGTLFLDRPEFLEPTSQLWLVAGFEDFGDIADQQNIMRFERWHLPKTADIEAVREAWWPKVRAAAIDGGLTSVWLLVGTDKTHPQLGLVTVTHGDPGETAPADAAGILGLETMPSPAQELADELSGTKVFDRTSWIYMIWHPIEEGDNSPHTAQWPVSPPLPGLPALS